MGTRHLICIIYKGQWVVAQYGQWDGYPEGQGRSIIRFLRLAANVEALKRGIAFVYQPTEAQISAMEAEGRQWEQNNADDDNPFAVRQGGVIALYPSLSRDTGAKILGMIAHATHDKRVPVFKHLEFANDALFCEYAYVVDLDNDILEVFCDSEHKSDGHRFKDVGPDDAPVPCFVQSFTFEEIYLQIDEQEFLDKVKEGLGDKGEGDLGEQEAAEHGVQKREP